ncbi:hypothetical protein BTUL_0086g00500 [Botrytis tulipae]|uniref:2,6-dihydroxypyridine 3-monooxygenase substrate binding domain-containing protein n=1 Tax=Botrytis tulipae TaxID=87230 RepID=A0A4Z1EJB9_9HELO|nr:hypothetical protein BTUL_0086g00500 [Botrytis tulipae]
MAEDRLNVVIEAGLSVTYEDIQTGTKEVLHPDLVIAADGAGSATTNFLFPDLKTPYAGFLTWRDASVTMLIGTTLYLIPGDDDSIKPGERYLNLAWYDTCHKDSPEYLSIMTDIDGKQHQRTVSFGKVRPSIWAQKRAYGRANFPSPIRELVNKIETPFVTGINHCILPKASCFEGRLFLVADAYALSRPHAAQSTNQCALHCLLLSKYLSGDITLEAYEKKVASFANTTLHWSRAIGSEYMDNMVGHLYHEFRFQLAKRAQN